MEAQLYLFPSFNEMIQMTAPAFQISVDALLGRPTSVLHILAVPMLVGGGVMCAFGEVNFSTVGISFAIASTIFRVSRIKFAEVRRACLKIVFAES